MTGDRTPTGDLCERLTEAMLKHYVETDKPNAGGHLPCVCGGWWDDNMSEGWDDHLADAVLPVVEAETAALRGRLAHRHGEWQRELDARIAAEQKLQDAERQRDEALAAVQRVREAADSVRAVLTTTSRDMSIDRTDAWLYGIFVGWDAEEPGEPESAMDEVAADHGWSAATVTRLRELRRAIAALDQPEDEPDGPGCHVIEVDGEPVRVQGDPDMPAEAREALADLVRAVQARLAGADQPEETP